MGYLSRTRPQQQQQIMSGVRGGRGGAAPTEGTPAGRGVGRGGRTGGGRGRGGGGRGAGRKPQSANPTFVAATPTTSRPRLTARLLREGVPLTFI